MRRTVSALVLAALVPGTAHAALHHLTAAQVHDAIAHGRAAYEERKTKTQPIDEVDPAYVVDRGPALGRVVLFTEFGTVALEARRWQAIGRELRPEDVETILRPLRGHLQFSVTFVGAPRDFLRHYGVRLVQAGREMRPATWDVYRGTPVTPGRYLASAIYRFPTGDIDLQAPVMLLVAPPEGAEERFEFDLRALR